MRMSESSAFGGFRMAVSRSDCGVPRCQGGLVLTFTTRRRSCGLVECPGRQQFRCSSCYSTSTRWRWNLLARSAHGSSVLGFYTHLLGCPYWACSFVPFPRPPYSTRRDNLLCSCLVSSCGSMDRAGALFSAPSRPPHESCRGSQVCATASHVIIWARHIRAGNRATHEPAPHAWLADQLASKRGSNGSSLYAVSRAE